jgi:hypothetical protein
VIVAAVDRLCRLLDALGRGEAVSARALLGALAHVYAASCELEAGAAVGEFEGIEPAERLALEHALAGLVGEARLYWVALDCTALHGEPELGCGDLVDDLADIYCDLAPAWRAQRRGAALADVLGSWSVSAAHWRRHAIDALGVLHRLVHDP